MRIFYEKAEHTANDKAAGIQEFQRPVRRGVKMAARLPAANSQDFASDFGQL